MNLHRLHVDELNEAPGSAGDRLLTALRVSGACILEVPQYGVLHSRSLAAARWLFSLDSLSKQFPSTPAADAQAAADVSCEFGGMTFRRAASEVFALERGWVPPGRSSSGVAKEYFQYGHDIPNTVTRSSRLMNVWPDCVGAQEFRASKLEYVNVVTRAHVAMCRAVSAALFDGRTDAFHRSPLNLICRDTRYLPRPSSEGAKKETWIRNKPHVDLGEWTLIKVEKGFELLDGDSSDHGRNPDESNAWAPVPPQAFGADEVLVIAGLALEIRLGGAVRAVWHRVVGSPEGPPESRYSIVTFGNAGLDDVLSPIPGKSESSRHYPAIRRDELPIVGNRAYMRVLGDS